MINGHDTATAYSRLTDALETNGSKIRSTGAQRAQAQCPAHQDGTASLTVTGIDGGVLFHCHAGCDPRDVLAALNLDMADMFDADRSGRYKRWDYVDNYRYDNGRTVYRTLDKQFPQSGTGNPPELYHLERVKQAVRQRKPIYVVEGEKDVHAVESVGAVATCSPMGAGKWGNVDSTPIHGATTVIVVADKDAPGVKHARDIEASLTGHVDTIRVVQAKTGKDAADHVAAGYGVNDFQPLPAKKSRHQVELTGADTITVRPVYWLWEGRLAIGTLGLLAGREGLGKSTLGYWIAARVSRGELPGEHEGTPKGVLICATEDSWEHTIVPRLIAAGADLARVYRVEVIADDIHVGLTLPRDIHQLGEAARRIDAALLLLDPLMSRLDTHLDAHRDGEVRVALEPLVSLADQFKISILGIIHHNKSGSTDPLQLVMGSKAFTAVARSVHTVVPDPDDENDERRLFGTPKNNLGRSNLPTLSFTMTSHAINTAEGVAWTGQLIWGAESPVSIVETMRNAADNDGDHYAGREAAGWLTDYLETQGGIAASADIKKAGRVAGHAERTLKRAMRQLGLAVSSSGFPRRTYWAIE